MAFKIHTLDKGVENVDTRIDAVWTLGSRYGNSLLVEGKKNGAIYWGDTFVKINPILLEEAKKTVRNKLIKEGYRL